MNLLLAVEGKEYIVSAVQTEDEELDSFLFSLGCFSGEPITVVSRRRGGCTVAIRDGRYNIDNQLAEFIEIQLDTVKGVRKARFFKQKIAGGHESARLVLQD